MPSCQGKSGDFSHGKRSRYSNREFGKRALTETGISLSQKNNFSTENPARFLRQVSYTGLEFFRKERRQCQTVRIPGATWMTSSSIRKTAVQVNDKRKPCRNVRPQRRFFFIFFLNSESAKAVHAFCDFLFRGCSFEPRFFNGNIHVHLAFPDANRRPCNMRDRLKFIR